jgi:hypothetical protein
MGLLRHREYWRELILHALHALAALEADIGQCLTPVARLKTPLNSTGASHRPALRATLGGKT